ncbi:MAG: pitrilysin family protein, partial [Arenicellales bacterium]
PARLVFAGVLVSMLAGVLLGTLGLSRTCLADDSTVLRATLDNGLRVVIVRNTLAPVATTTVNYLVGSNETPPGFPGTAHAQEHMMFRGSPGLSADQLAYIGGVMGGRFNADTRHTVTQYYFTVPAEDLDVALHVQALRMRDVLDTEKDWEQERGAIEQEVAQDISSPGYLMYTKLLAALFKGTVYAHDALGTRPSFDKTTAADLKAFHDKWYAPNNAVLIVAGNVDPTTTLDHIKKLFGPIPAKDLPARPKIDLQPVKSQSFTLKSDRPYAQHVIALRMPGLDSPDYAAVDVLADVIDSKRGALYQLVPEGKAFDTSFSYEPLPEAGMAFADVKVPEGTDIAALDKRVRSILSQIAEHGVPADLVAAAKLQERRDLEFTKNSIQGLANVWSEAVAVYGLDSPDQDLARIEKVTVDDVNRAAKKYLRLDQTVTATLVPQHSGKPAASGGFGGQENISLGAVKPTKVPDWAEAALSHVSVPASTTHPTVTKLANGITLIVQPESVSDTISVIGHVKHRASLQVPPGKEGLDMVLGDLFSYGTEHLDRLAYQRALDEIGARAQAGDQFSLRVLADKFDRGVELLADNELHPALPKKAFEVVKHQTLQTVTSRLKSPGYLSDRALRIALFPKDDPVLRQALPKTVSGITIQDVRDYYHQVIRPDLTTIVVIGKVTPERARTVIEKYFGDWTAKGPTPDTDLPAAPDNASSKVAVPDSTRVQDRVDLAETLGLTRKNPDYYALSLGNTVLGGSFYSTRLTRHLRKEAGLVYYVASELDIGKTRGVYYIEYACDPDNVARVQRIVTQELEGMQSEPVSPNELSQAQAYLVRQIPLSEASLEAIAHGFIRRIDLGLPLDEPTVAARNYLQLNAADVQAAFKKWLRPHDLVRVSQGPSPK